MHRRSRIQKYELIGYVPVASRFQELLESDQGGYLGYHGVSGVGKTKLRKYLMYQIRMQCAHTYAVELTYDSAGERDPWNSDQLEYVEARQINSTVVAFFATIRAAIKEIVRKHKRSRDPDSLFYNYDKAEREYVAHLTEAINRTIDSADKINITLHAEGESEISHNQFEIRKWFASDEHRHHLVTLVDAFIRDVNRLPTVKRKWPWQRVTAPSLRLALAVDGLDLVDQEDTVLIDLLRILKAQFGSSGILLCSGRSVIDGLTDTYTLKGLSFAETQQFLSGKGIRSSQYQQSIYDYLKIGDEDGNEYVVPVTLALTVEYLSTFVDDSLAQGLHSLIDYKTGHISERMLAERILRKYLIRVRAADDVVERWSEKQRTWYRQLHTLVYYGAMLVRYKPIELVETVFVNFPRSNVFVPPTNFERIVGKFQNEIVVDRHTLELHHMLRSIARAMLWEIDNDPEDAKRRDHVHVMALNYYQAQGNANSPEAIWHQIAVDPSKGFEQLYSNFVKIQDDISRVGVLFNLATECATRIQHGTLAYRWFTIIQVAKTVLFDSPLLTTLHTTQQLNPMQSEALDRLRELRRLPDLDVEQKKPVLGYLSMFLVEKPGSPAEWGDQVWVYHERGFLREAAEAAIQWADAHRNLSQLDRCLEICEMTESWCESIEPGPDDWQPRVASIKASALHIKGYYKQARGFADFAVQQFSALPNRRVEEARARLDFGLILIALHELTLALNQFEKAYNGFAHDTIMQVDVIYRTGQVLDQLGRADDAIDRFETAEQLLRDRSAHHFIRGNIAYSKGLVYLSQNKLPQAKYCMEEAGHHFELEGTEYEIALAEAGLGDVLSQNDQLFEALDIYQSALTRYGKLGAEVATASTGYKITKILIVQNRFDEAEQFLKDSLRLYEGIDSQIDIAQSHLQFAQIYLGRQHYESAEKAYLTAIEHYRKSEGKEWEAHCYRALGTLHKIQKNVQSAEQAYIKALTYYQDYELWIWATWIWATWTCCDLFSLHIGTPSSQQYLQKIYEFAERIDDTEERQKVLNWTQHNLGESTADIPDAADSYNTAQSLVLQRKFDEAEPFLESSLKIYEDLGYQVDIANCQLRFAEIHVGRQHYQSAEVAYLAAIEHYRKGEEKEWEAHCYRDLGTLYKMKKDNQAAESAYNKALDFYQDNEIWTWAAWTCCDLHTVHAGDSSSQSYLQKAHEFVDRISNLEERQKILDWIQHNYGQMRQTWFIVN